MKRIISSILLVSLLALIVGCDNEDVIPVVKGDAFIIAKVDGQDTVFGLALHAMGNVALSSVAAVDDDGNTFQLKSYGGYLYEFYFDSENADYSLELPVVGRYEFTAVTAKGETRVVQDELTDDIIYPADLTCEFDVTNSQISLGWEKMDDADYIVLILKDDEGETVYISAALVGSSVGYNIKATTATWANGRTPQDGSTYTAEVHAFMYESNGEAMNVQAKSIASGTVVWGEGGN